MNWLLDVSCSLLSVTVAGNNLLKIIDVKTPFGINMPTYCGMQPEAFERLGSSTKEHYVRLAEDVTTIEPMDQINGVLLTPQSNSFSPLKLEAQ
ncbi:unnamed protein product [Dicrocoelium dendriticum]|nr:unnamed protein product [Dicrocoelium dendriticum]